MAALLDRPYRRLVDDLPVDYVGFTVPDEFFVGYGFDVDGRWRNLPDLRTRKSLGTPKLLGYTETVMATRSAAVATGSVGVAQRALRAPAGSCAILPFLGPAFVACVAYIDPGNFATEHRRRRKVRLHALSG